jgi:hypothetical protein
MFSSATASALAVDVSWVTITSLTSYEIRISKKVDIPRIMAIIRALLDEYIVIQDMISYLDAESKNHIIQFMIGPVPTGVGYCELLYALNENICTILKIQCGMSPGHMIQAA